MIRHDVFYNYRRERKEVVNLTEWLGIAIATLTLITNIVLIAQNRKGPDSQDEEPPSAE